jgi:phosphoglycerate dehydrogenase-like enzyme
MSVPVNVLVVAPHLGRDLGYVEQVDERVSVLDGNAGDLDALLEAAEVLLLGFPVPAVIAARAPRLRWVHHTQAGVSNLWGCDLWDSEVTLTSSRGRVGPRAIAEYAMAGAFHFARGIDTAMAQKAAGAFARDGYAMLGLQGSTLGVVGLGGIGREVARLARGVGMRVLATRRSARPGDVDDDADELFPAAALHEMLARTDVVVVCSQLTSETEAMFDSAAFAAMKPGAVFVNVARGEEVVEDALVEAARSGRLRGALLDVHAGESTGAPPLRELLETPNIILTPHISGAGDRAGREPVKALFAENLRRYLAGESLVNLVDRGRGY